MKIIKGPWKPERPLFPKNRKQLWNPKKTLTRLLKFLKKPGRVLFFQALSLFIPLKRSSLLRPQKGCLLAGFSGIIKKSEQLASLALGR